MNIELMFVLDLLVLATTAVVSLFLLLRNKKNLLMFLLVPFVFLSCFDAYRNVDSLLGLSRSATLPEGEVSVLSTAVEQRKWIHLWYVDAEIKQPRAIKIPYTEENRKKVESINKKLRGGQEAFVELKRKGRPTGSFIGPETIEIIEYNFSTTFSSQKHR
jgi:hypothetical protein